MNRLCSAGVVALLMAAFATAHAAEPKRSRLVVPGAWSSSLAPEPNESPIVTPVYVTNTEITPRSAKEADPPEDLRDVFLMLRAGGKADSPFERLGYVSPDGDVLIASMKLGFQGAGLRFFKVTARDDKGRIAAVQQLVDVYVMNEKAEIPRVAKLDLAITAGKKKETDTLKEPPSHLAPAKPDIKRLPDIAEGVWQWELRSLRADRLVASDKHHMSNYSPMIKDPKAKPPVFAIIRSGPKPDSPIWMIGYAPPESDRMVLTTRTATGHAGLQLMQTTRDTSGKIIGLTQIVNVYMEDKVSEKPNVLDRKDQIVTAQRILE